jgi:transcriptional regulator with XRE-family HTH domain
MLNYDSWDIIILKSLIFMAFPTIGVEGKNGMRKVKKNEKELAISERLKYLRNLRQLSQAELARTSGVSQATVAQIESGRKDPSVTTLKKLASALDVTIGIFFSTDTVHVFDMARLRRKYKKAEDLNPTVYRALDQVIRYAKDIGFL